MEALSSVLSQIKPSLLKNCTAQEAALLAWPMICGARTAEQTRASAFADGVLTVVVPQKEWKKELQSLAPQYCAKLNALLPEKVEKIVFVTSHETEQKSR